MSDPNAGLILILRKTLPWVRVLSIFGFVLVACFAVLGAVSVIGVIERVDSMPIAAVVVYPAAVVLFLIPSLYLHKYGRRIGTFVAQGHTAQLEAALEEERRFWRFMGILALTAAVLALTTLVAAMVIGVLAGV